MGKQEMCKLSTKRSHFTNLSNNNSIFAFCLFSLICTGRIHHTFNYRKQTDLTVWHESINFHLSATKSLQQ